MICTSLSFRVCPFPLTESQALPAPPGPAVMLPWILAGAATGLAAGPGIRASAARHQVTHLGMPDFRPSVGRLPGAAGGQ
jgi:hypothetical protein